MQGHRTLCLNQAARGQCRSCGSFLLARLGAIVGEEEEGSSGRVLPMGIVGATPAQVSRALKVHNHLYGDGIIQ